MVCASLTDLPDIMIESRFASRIVQEIQPLSDLGARQEKTRDLSVPPPPAPAPPDEIEMSNPISDSSLNDGDMPTCDPKMIDPLSSWAILPTNNPRRYLCSFRIDTTVANGIQTLKTMVCYCM